MDDADHAQVTEALALRLALEAQARRAGEAGPPSADGLCHDCSEPIGEARLKALPKTGRCVSCAEVAEQHYRHHAWRGQ